MGITWTAFSTASSCEWSEILVNSERADGYRLSVETQLPATLSYVARSHCQPDTDLTHRAIAFMVSYAIEANSAMNIFFE